MIGHWAKAPTTAADALRVADTLQGPEDSKGTNITSSQMFYPVAFIRDGCHNLPPSYHFSLTMEWIQMESHLYDNHLTAINYTVAGILVLLLVVQWHRTATARLDLPVVGDISQKDFRPALEEGAQKVYTDYPMDD